MYLVGPSFYPLYLVERIILILELRGILTENFLGGDRSRTAEAWVAGPSTYPLDHEVLVEGIILELPDEVQGRGILTDDGLRTELLTKYSKSKSLTLIGLGHPTTELLRSNNSGTS